MKEQRSGFDSIPIVGQEEEVEGVGERIRNLVSLQQDGLGNNLVCQLTGTDGKRMLKGFLRMYDVLDNSIVQFQKKRYYA